MALTAAVKYEVRMVTILCLVAGLMVFEQASVFYLMPFIRPALKLTNGQVGALASAYWVTFAISSYATSQLADRVGKRKRFLLVTVILISIFSVSSAFASSFSFLLAARAVMGLLEGPLFPIAQSIVALESPEKRRGTNMGLVGNFGPGILQGVVAPIVLVRVAAAFGWHAGCLLLSAGDNLRRVRGGLYLGSADAGTFGNRSGRQGVPAEEQSA